MLITLECSATPRTAVTFVCRAEKGLISMTEHHYHAAIWIDHEWKLSTIQAMHSWSPVRENLSRRRTEYGRRG